MNIILSIIFYIFNIADLIFTMRLVKKYGIDIESNPLGKWLLKNPKIVYAVKIGLAGIAAVLLAIFDSTLLKICRWLLASVYTALFAYHLYIIKKANEV